MTRSGDEAPRGTPPAAPGEAPPGALTAALVVGSLLAAVTCSGARVEPASATAPGAGTSAAAATGTPAAGPTAAAAVAVGPSGSAAPGAGGGTTAGSAAAPPPPPPAASAAPPPPPAASAAPPLPPGPPTLARFREALLGLERGARQQPVRVVWLGDSHTAADFMTDVVRARLQGRFGNGGPGFVNVGMDGAPHGRVEITASGKFRREPAAPTSHERQGDGVFGPGGRRSTPMSSDAGVRLRLRRGASAGPVTWEVLFTAPTARFEARTEQRTLVLDGQAGRPGPAGSPLRHATLEGDAGGTLELGAFSGAVTLFGVHVESRTPGVVLDTLGINGARVTTPLAWEPRAWSAEFARRAPSLLVLAYGTNDIPAHTPVEAYAAQYRAMVERARAAVPELDCLLVGPTDLARPDGTSHPRAAAIDAIEAAVAAELGCEAFSVVALMGGEGGMQRWMNEDPPLAQRDRIHLSLAGYRRVGEAIAERLLTGVPPHAGTAPAQP